jgi:hypothetical protein
LHAPFLTRPVPAFDDPSLHRSAQLTAVKGKPGEGPCKREQVTPPGKATQVPVSKLKGGREYILMKGDFVLIDIFDLKAPAAKVGRCCESEEGVFQNAKI